MIVLGELRAILSSHYELQNHGPERKIFYQLQECKQSNVFPNITVMQMFSRKHKHSQCFTFSNVL